MDSRESLGIVVNAYIAIPEGEHDIRIDYFERGGLAGITIPLGAAGFAARMGRKISVLWAMMALLFIKPYVNTYKRNGAIAKLGCPAFSTTSMLGKTAIPQDFEGGSDGRGAIYEIVTPSE